VDFAAIGVPEELGLVLRRAIAKQASERFSSGAELMEAARAAATGKPIDARGPSTVRSTAPFPMMRRGHWRRIVPLLTGAIVVAGLAGFLWSRSEFRVSRTARGLIVEEQPGFLAKLLGAKPRRVITVPKATRLALALETPLTSGTARVGHPFTAALREPIQVEGFVVVAAGSRIRGRVSRAEPAGESASPGRLSLKADTLVLPNGDQIPIETGATSFAGQSPSKKDSGFLGSIGGKVSGLFGGKDEKRDPLPEAVLAEGTTFSLRLTAPFAVGRPIGAEVE
jgi:hypothetical protein